MQTIGTDGTINVEIIGTGPQGARGETGAPGVSPGVIVTGIPGGHRVTITDAAHPSGQSFDVMDGATQVASDYDELSNKPQIGFVTLSGSKTPAELGLVAAEQGKGLSTNDFTAAQKSVVDALAALQTADNNGKVLSVQSGAFAAVNVTSLLPDGDEVSY